jgi:hypothetical protein
VLVVSRAALMLVLLLAVRFMSPSVAVKLIEQIDIDEMSELVGDLQADKKYYQTNIALAASSLAAKTTALAAQLAYFRYLRYLS